MKKAILSVVLGMATIAMSAAVGRTLPARPDNPRFSSAAAFDVAAPTVHNTRAASSILYNLAGDPYQAIGFNNAKAGQKFANAFEFTAAEASAFAGNQITHINFYNGVNTVTKVNSIKKARVFLTYDLEAEPFYSQEADLTAKAFDYKQVELTEPYTIEAGKSFFVGVEWAIGNSKDYAIVIDYMDHGDDDRGGYVAYHDGTKHVWDNIASGYGFVCVSASIAGDNLPSNRVALDQINIPMVVTAGEPFEAWFTFVNNGAEDVSSIDVAYNVGDGQLKNYSLSINPPVAYGQIGELMLPNLTFAGHQPNVEFAMTITKVNGNDNLSPDAYGNYFYNSAVTGSTFTRNVVIEELTGNWCGYCPVGIACMEKIREKYTDGSFIPVAIHTGNGEPMADASFNGAIALNTSGGVPASYINRMVQTFPWPFEDVESYYTAIRAIPAITRVDATAAFDSESSRDLIIDTRTYFTYADANAAANYGLTFVLVEDQVGPYTQENYYAGYTQDCGGWEKKPSKVSMLYNDVARQMIGFKGDPGSIPTSVEAATGYDYRRTITLPANVSKKSNVSVVVYVTNLKNLVIENAVLIRPENISAGVTDVTAGADNAPVEYFNLQGVRVDNPSAGVYIRRQGNTAAKVMLQ